MDHVQKIIQVRIREKSFLARCAAWLLRSDAAAMVWGNTVFVYGATARELMQNKRWWRHELKHVEQFANKGYGWFSLLYLWQILYKGYRNNRYEKEARAAESDEHLEELFEVKEGN